MLFDPPLNTELFKKRPNKNGADIVVDHTWLEWFRLVGVRISSGTTIGGVNNPLASLDEGGIVINSGYIVDDTATDTESLWTSSKINTVFLAAGDVTGPGSSTDNAVVRFDSTTGKLIQNSVVTIDNSGNIATAGTVDGRDVSTDGGKLDGIGAGADVVGPGTATDNAIARFNLTTGKLLQNSSVTVDDSGNIATSGTVDGRDLSTDGAKLDGIGAGADVVGPGSATDHAIARFDLTTGKLLQNSSVTVDDSGNIATSGTVDGRDLSTDGAKLDGIGAGADVVGPGSATDNAVARFDLTTGKIVQNSTVTIDDSGNIATSGTVDGRDVSTDGAKLDGIGAGADVVGPGSSTDNAVPRFDSTTGKILQGSAVIIGDTNNVTGVVDLSCTNVDAVTAYKVGGTQVLATQQAAESDAAAPTNYTAHASGAVTVTSNAATDLDTTAAALATLENEVTALTTTVNNLLAKVRTHGIIAT